MKVDSPSADMDNKALVFDDDNEDAMISDDDGNADQDDLEPPTKRHCRGRESALVLAMRETGKSRYVSFS